MPGCPMTSSQGALAHGTRMSRRRSRIASILAPGLAFLLVPGSSGGGADAARMDADGHLHTDHAEFHFTRAVYTGIRWRNWAIDYPKADRQLMTGVRRLLTHLDACGEVNPVRLDDPDLGRYPFVYAVEVGHMAMSEAEVEG